eukprot:1965194-Pyramimonas_sp.AAC.1
MWRVWLSCAPTWQPAWMPGQYRTIHRRSRRYSRIHSHSAGTGAQSGSPPALPEKFTSYAPVFLRRLHVIFTLHFPPPFPTPIYTKIPCPEARPVARARRRHATSVNNCREK